MNDTGKEKDTSVETFFVLTFCRPRENFFFFGGPLEKTRALTHSQILGDGLLTEFPLAFQLFNR